MEEKNRKPVYMWPRLLPIAEEPQETWEIVGNYNNWLKKTQIPKLLLYAEPGALINKERAEKIVQTFPNTKSVNVGTGSHFIQEDQPTNIGNAISSWLKGI